MKFTSAIAYIMYMQFDYWRRLVVIQKPERPCEWTWTGLMQNTEIDDTDYQSDYNAFDN